MVFSKKDMFSEFVKGAAEGLNTVVKLLPTLVALLAAIAMFNASGCAGALAAWLTPVAERMGLPPEIIPLVIVRPLSGGASTALIDDIFKNYGADSLAGRCASLIAGSSDTLLYVFSVYFGSVGIKKTRGTLPVGIIVMVFCVFLACFLCRLFF